MWSPRTSLALQSVVVLSLWHLTAASSTPGLLVASTSDSTAATESFPQSHSTIVQQSNNDTTSTSSNTQATTVLSADLHTGTTSLLNINTTSAVFSSLDTLTSWSSQFTNATQSPSLDLAETSLASIQATPTLVPSWDSIAASFTHLPTTSTQRLASDIQSSLPDTEAISASLSHASIVCVTVPYTALINTDLSILEPSRANFSNTHASSVHGAETLAAQTPRPNTHDGSTIVCTTEDISPSPSASIYITSPSDSNTPNGTRENTEAASTKSSTTTSTPLTTVPASYAIAPNVSFPFQLKYDFVVFHKDLEDPTSAYYRESVVNYTERIKPAYKNVTGFQDITITKFWNGSVGVDYNVVIAYNLTDEEFIKELHEIVYPYLEKSGVNQTFLQDTFNKSIQNALDVLTQSCRTSSSFCTGDFLCVLGKDSKPSCRPLCTNSEAINKCENGGRCVQDAPNNFICRCPEDQTFLYGGQYCEVQAEKLGLKKDYIIAIACGAGGGVILILIIIIIILSQRRRPNKHSKDDKDNASEQSFKSIKDSEDGLHQNQPGNRNSSLLDYSNPTFSVPQQRTENVHMYPRSTPGGGYPATANPLQLTSKYGISDRSGQTRQAGPAVNAARPGASQSLLTQDRTSSRDQPGIYPNIQRQHPSPDYLEIEDINSKAFMYQPTRVMKPLSEFHQGRPLHSPSDPKVYDYSNRAESRANPERSGTYDFLYENGRERGSRMNDPYSIKRPNLLQQK